MANAWRDKQGRFATLDIYFESNVDRLIERLRDLSSGPNSKGKLAASWRKGGGGITVNKKGDGITVRNELPYAYIQDRGGVIPARSAVNARVMRFVWRGAVNFAPRVGPSVIPAKNIVRTAVLETFDRGELFKVHWGKHGGQNSG